MKEVPELTRPRLAERCFGSYLLAFGSSTRCALPKGHGGRHGPAVPPPRPAPAVQGSPTSEHAARALTKGKRAQDKIAIFTVIERSPRGLTDEEIAKVLGMDGNTERPRRLEVQAEGKIKKHPTHTRLTKSGRPAAVWIVA